jgi:Serine carboxypeptidase
MSQYLRCSSERRNTGVWYELATRSSEYYVVSSSTLVIAALCPLLTYAKQRPDVLGALHAQAKSEAWVECHPRVGDQLRQAVAPSSVTVLPRLLERIPVLLFAGDQDLICNYLGQESLIQSLTWNGGTGLGVRTRFFLWTVNNECL